MRKDLKKISILAPGEVNGRLIERERGVNTLPVSPLVSTVGPLPSEELSMEGNRPQDEHLPEVSLETQALRTKLRYLIPPKHFPNWLADVEVEGIGKDGTIVVTFENELMVDYCRVRFGREILQSATSLWGDVNRLVVRHKLDDATYPSVEKLSKSPENLKEKSMFEQALRSLLSVCSPHKPIGLRTEENCPDFY